MLTIGEARTTIVGTPWRELVFLELTTDSGLVGVGEVRMVNKTETLVACIGELAPRYVIGADPFDVERLAWNVQRAEYGRPGEITQSALAAFDVACWDLMGQTLGVPVWKLLGGTFRHRVPAYANGWYQAEREPTAIARLARAVVQRGYRALKLDPFGAASAELPAADRRRAEAIVAGVRDAVGPDVQMLVEMHGRFTPATASRVAAMLEPYDPEWIEEPVPPENASALAQVRAATRIPIATGERAHTIGDIREFVERGLADVIQVDLTHFGGFLPMKHLAGWADAHYLLLAAAQRLRSGRNDGQRPLRRRDAELQGARALQRLRRSMGAGARRSPAGRRVGRLLRSAGPARPRRAAQSRGMPRASADRRTFAVVRSWMGAAWNLACLNAQLARPKGSRYRMKVAHIKTTVARGFQPSAVRPRSAGSGDA